MTLNEAMPKPCCENMAICHVSQPPFFLLHVSCPGVDSILSTKLHAYGIYPVIVHYHNQLNLVSTIQCSWNGIIGSINVDSPVDPARSAKDSGNGHCLVWNSACPWPSFWHCTWRQSHRPTPQRTNGNCKNNDARETPRLMDSFAPYSTRFERLTNGSQV